MALTYISQYKLDIKKCLYMTKAFLERVSFKLFMQYSYLKKLWNTMSPVISHKA
jgi:hypothetical protein